VAGVLAVVCCGVVPQAYVLKGTKWLKSPVGYYVNPTSRTMTPADVRAVYKDAADDWSTQAHSAFAYQYLGDTTATTIGYGQNGGKNVVLMRNAIYEPNPSIAAVATSWSRSDTKQLLQFAIVAYEGRWLFLPDNATCSATANGLYLHDTLNHEFGHALGLAHSNVGTATMYGAIKLCSKANRVLDPDDIAAVEAIYGKGREVPPPGFEFERTADLPDGDYVKGRVAKKRSYTAKSPGQFKDELTYSDYDLEDEARKPTKKLKRVPGGVVDGIMMQTSDCWNAEVGDSVLAQMVGEEVVRFVRLPQAK
jgi:hypothetical protein